MRSPCCLSARLISATIFFVFYAVRVLSKERRLLVLPRSSYLLIVYIVNNSEGKRFLYSNRIKISLGFGFICVHLLIVHGQTFFRCLHTVCVGVLNFFFSPNAFVIFSVDVHIVCHLHGHFKNNLTKICSRKQNDPPAKEPVSQPLKSQT
jgi:hypothetical protein